MIYPFSVYRAYTGDNFFWVAKSTVLERVIGQGKTAKKAIRELRKNEKAWLDYAKANQDSISIPNVPVVSIDDKSILEVLPKI
jgi:hypothetical protein